MGVVELRAAQRTSDFRSVRVGGRVPTPLPSFSDTRSGVESVAW